ncbi:hypothetical protein J437_LFUL012076 [Ladona fulva]|uniref:Cytochrome c oxidase assembly protein COX16 homolog, mitochondrial n=1 Tax=Ladona fulva TaxID=123851 RepID=A0A8K0P125_LADFU|nr:hypothetical protein J437_LFUL012076 [Ladona fulva]
MYCKDGNSHRCFLKVQFKLQLRVSSMSDWHSKFHGITKKKSFRFGLPFILMVVGGSFVLEQFAQNRYRFSKRMPITPELAEKYGVQMKKPGEVTLESEYEKIKDDLELDNE